MDRTPLEIYNYLCLFTGSNGSKGCPRSGGCRYSFYINKKVVVNHIVPTSDAKNAREYILIKNIPEHIKIKYSKEFQNAGKNSIGISDFNFKQLHNIIDNIYKSISSSSE